MTLLDLDAITVAGYRLRTGDRTSDGESVSGSLVEAESILEEELRRELPLPLMERVESMIISDGRMYPKAYPIIECESNTIDGRALLGGAPDLPTFLAYWPDYDSSITPRAEITYTGGFDADTLPVTLAHAIYDMARALVADVSPVPVGATSVSVGDVSVSYGSVSGAAGVDVLVPGLGARVARYKNRFV